MGILALLVAGRKVVQRAEGGPEGEGPVRRVGRRRARSERAERVVGRSLVAAQTRGHGSLAGLGARRRESSGEAVTTCR